MSDREDIQSVFDPIFKQILGLVKKQMATVRALGNHSKIKVNSSAVAL